METINNHINKGGFIMVKKCIECKYFNDDPDSMFGKCSLHYGYKKKNHTCDDFTNYLVNKAESINDHYYYKIHDLEMRIEKLEKIIWKYL